LAEKEMKEREMGANKELVKLEKQLI